MSAVILAVLIGLVGAVAGTVVASVVERMPRHLPVMANPLACPVCGKGYPLVAQLPFGGFAANGATCTTCGAPTPWRKAALETAAAVCFALITWRFGLTVKTAVFLWYAVLLIAVFAIDLEHRLILNRMMYPAIVAAPFTALLTGVSLPSSLIGGLLGFAVMLVMYLAARGGLGGGDVRLGLFIGLVTGAQRVFPAMLAFSLVAGVVSAFLLISRKKGPRDAIAFGPFMVVGVAWVLWWLG